MRELGAIAAHHFDVVDRPRGRPAARPPRGEVAGLVAEGVRTAIEAGARCQQVEIVLDELEATRHAIARSNPGDLIVICVDQHAVVMAELESYGRQAQPGARSDGEPASGVARVGDPDFSPTATMVDQEEALTLP